VREIDLKYPGFSKTFADEFHIRDLPDQTVSKELLTLLNDIKVVDEIYQFAADIDGQVLYSRESMMLILCTVQQQ
jgi:hypothetical protein